MAFAWSTAAVAAAIVSGRLFSALAPLPNISMVFLMAVLFSAVSFGMRPAIYASILSFLSYNFFFIEPLHTFQVAQPHELLALSIFLIVAIVTSALAGRVRDQARAANERARSMRRLYEFTWKLSGLDRRRCGGGRRRRRDSYQPASPGGDTPASRRRTVACRRLAARRHPGRPDPGSGTAVIRA